jgi:hypothetical protein
MMSKKCKKAVGYRFPDETLLSCHSLRIKGEVQESDNNCSLLVSCQALIDYQSG